MPDLSTLPPELISQISQYLSTEDLAALNLVNHQLHGDTAQDLGIRLREWMAAESHELMNQLLDLPADGTGIDGFLDAWQAKIDALLAIDWSAYSANPNFLAHEYNEYRETLRDLIHENLLTKVQDVMTAEQQNRCEQIRAYAANSL